jgi:hypothetical protein
MARRSRSPRQAPLRRRKTRKASSRKGTLRGGVRWPTEAECLQLFQSKRPNAGLRPRYSICKRLHSLKYLQEAQKRYGEGYGHYSFVPRKLFGKKYSRAKGASSKAPKSFADLHLQVSQEMADAEGQAGSPQIERASMLSPPRSPVVGAPPPWVPPPPPPPPPPPTPTAGPGAHWGSLGKASSKTDLGIAQASFIDELARVGRSGLRKVKKEDVTSTQPLSELQKLRMKIRKQVGHDDANDDGLD